MFALIAQFGQSTRLLTEGSGVRIPVGALRGWRPTPETMSQKEYSARTEEITVVDGVKVDIEVCGNEDRAEKVLMDLKNRLGWIAEAYDEEVPPDHLDERSWENTAPMTVNWDHVFDEQDDG